MGKLDAMDHLKFEHSRGANMMIPASSSTQYPHHDCSSTRCYWEMAIGTRNIPNYCCLTCWWYSHYGWSVAPCWLAYASVYPKIQINEAANNYHTNKSTNHSWSGSVFNEFRLYSFFSSSVFPKELRYSQMGSSKNMVLLHHHSPY